MSSDKLGSDSSELNLPPPFPFCILNAVTLHRHSKVDKGNENQNYFVTY